MAGVDSGIEAVGRACPIKLNTGAGREGHRDDARNPPPRDARKRSNRHVLTVSPEAAALVRQLVRTADLPEGSGLRIVVDGQHHSLSMGLAHGPEPQDDVVSSGGARVFLSQPATGRLESRTLEAEVTDLRSVFYLSG